MDSKVNPMDKSPSAETINAPAPQVPRTFFQYLRSFGPGIVIAMTWMGAGDVVESAVAGGNYGYALMWVLALALVVRFLFVSLIAKYQLCNQRGEGVLDGLGRLHPWYPPFLALMGVVIGHIQGAYLIVGIGEISVNVTGIGYVWLWGLFWNLVTLAIVFRPVYGRLELLFKVLLGLLSVSFLGAALWVGPSPSKILQGVFAFDLPAQVGPFGSLLVAIGLIGTIGGSLANLVYPYFLEQKGWIGPAFRRVQFYDLLLGIVVLIVLDLAIWTLGCRSAPPARFDYRRDGGSAPAAEYDPRRGRPFIVLSGSLCRPVHGLGGSSPWFWCPVFSWVPALAGWPRGPVTGTPRASELPVGRSLVPDFPGRLDCTRYAGLCRHDRIRRHRLSGVDPLARGRLVVDYRQGGIHRRRVQESPVGERPHGRVVRLGTVGGLRFGKVDRRVVLMLGR